MNKNKLIPISIFLFTFIIYLTTLAPTITSEDSGDFINCADKFIIAHPTGYPLYCITGKIFTFIPIGSIPYRVNLMSAFFASLSSIFIFLILKKLTNNYPISITTALIFAFSNSIWSQAVIAEVYTLNIFFLTLLTYIGLQYKETKNIKKLCLFAFIFGLSLTNHVMNIFYVPAFLILFKDRFKTIIKPKNLIVLSILFLIGLSVYLFVPYSIEKSRGSPTIIPYFDPSKPVLTNTLDVMTAKLYRSQTDFQLKLKNILLRSKSLFLQFFKEISLLILISFFGIFYLIKKDKPLFLFLFTIIFINFLYTIYVNIYPMYITKFGIPALFSLMLFFAYGLVYIFTKLNFSNKKIAYLIICLTLIPLLSNYGNNDQSNNYLTYNYGKDIMTTIPKESFLYIISDDAYFPINFHNTIERQHSKKFSALYEGASLDNIHNAQALFNILEREGNYNGLLYIPDFRNLEIQYYQDLDNPFSSLFNNQVYFKQFGILYAFSNQQVKQFPINPWKFYNETGFEDKKIPKSYIDTVRIIFYYQMLINNLEKDSSKEIANKQIPHILKAKNQIKNSYSGFLNEERSLLFLQYLLINSNYILNNQETADSELNNLKNTDLINPELIGLKNILVNNLNNQPKNS